MELTPDFTDQFPAQDTYLIGVSGGLDSVSLLHLLTEQYNYKNLIVCHVNHLLRASDSDTDEQFVLQLANKYNLQCATIQVDIATQALKYKKSIEATARIVRHNFFAQTAMKHNAQQIILAHHANDQAETILMNFLRGSGISGLAGMAMITDIVATKINLRLIRPLLHIYKKQLLSFAKQYKLDFREDHSNKQQLFTRNKIRDSVIPLLNNTLNRDTENNIVKLGNIASIDKQYWQNVLDKVSQRAIINNKLIIEIAQDLHPALQNRLILHWLQLNNISNITKRDVDNIAVLLSCTSKHKINLPKDCHATKTKNYLSIITPTK